MRTVWDLDLSLVAGDHSPKTVGRQLTAAKPQSFATSGIPALQCTFPPDTKAAIWLQSVHSPCFGTPRSMDLESIGSARRPVPPRGLRDIASRLAAWNLRLTRPHGTPLDPGIPRTRAPHGFGHLVRDGPFICRSQQTGARLLVPRSGGQAAHTPVSMPSAAHLTKPGS